MIEFRKTGQTIKSGWPDIRNKKMNWGNTALRMTYEYEEGYIYTSKKSKVLAYKLVENSLQVELFDRTTGAVIPKPPSYFDQFKFDLSYNCFGYCFADSEVFLPDPTQFIEDDYEETDYDNAELVVFKTHNGYGDNHEIILQNFHAAKKLPNGNVSFKPGINGLIENIDENLAIHDYNFNHKVYLKKREV